MGSMLPDMKDFAENLQQRWEEIKGNVYTSHEEALAELTGAFSKSSVGSALEEAGFDWTFDGLANVTNTAYQQASNEYTAFTNAIEWTDPIIYILGGVHGLLWLIWLATVVIGCSPEFKIGFFVCVVLLAGAASFINSWAHDNWEMVATQNYFHPSGVFLAVMYCGPLVILLFCILCQLLLDVFRLLVRVKTAQLKRTMKSRNKQVEKKKDE